MLRKLLGRTTLVLAMTAVLSASAVVANAQCCGQGAYTVGYQPVTAYQPVAHQAYRPYTGWYPGYWLGRLFSPRAYTAAYAPTYTAAYAPAYTAAYAPTYTASYAHTVGYPVSLTAYQGVASCSTCGTSPCGCATQSVVMRPAGCCDTCGSSACSCGSSGVTQAVYESGSGCPNCAAAPASYAAPQYDTQQYDTQQYDTQQYGSPSDTRSTVPQTFGPTPQPELAPDEAADTQRTLRLDAPSTIPSEYNFNSGSGTTRPSSYFEAPKLFDSQDKVTQRPTTPVWTAVYHRPVDSRPAVQNVSYKPVTQAQAELDAQGWSDAN